MTISLLVQHHSKGPLITVGGDIDTLTAPQLEACLSREIKEEPQVFVIDMSEVRYISSMGLRVFLKHLKALKATNGSLIIAAAGKLVSDVFQMSGFSGYFEMLPSVDSCIKELGITLPG